MKIRKKPVEIDAEIYKVGMEDGFEERYLNKENPSSTWGIPTDKEATTVLIPYIETLEGRHLITKGDWIITGIKGERYPVKDEIFKLTYEKVV